ncbi:cell wall-binding repeat-containing protein [Anoxybacillus ayderensis]|uniref:cell wall-binding repeat-containing protein n=1 Tax=Anoxybacillus ayderensis TaxID=265546 RepID=UPI0015EC497B
MLKKLFFLFCMFIFFGLAYDVHAQTISERIDGKDRFEVAVNISKKGWTGGSDVVILANYNAFADALSASTLAYKHNAPILLTHSDRLTDSTREEIRRLMPREVIVIGGYATISSDVINQLKQIGVSTVRRIDGKDRYEVAYNIANELPASQTVIIAYGLAFADALTIAPYAAQNAYPILLSNKDSISSGVLRYISENNVNQIIIVGGEGSISKAIENQLKESRSVTRISGTDRYEVSVNIAKQLMGANRKFFVASGLTFADALTGSILAAKENAPILLTRPNVLPSSIQSFINQNSVSQFVILGGNASVQPSIFDKMFGPLAGIKIVVDPGHGKRDTGAIGNGLLEKEVVLDIGNRLKTKLNRAGAIVIMTREDDSYPTLSERVETAHKNGADAFVSIHLNANEKSSPNGTETYWNSRYASEESKRLAEEIQKRLVKSLGTKDRGIKQGNFYVIKYTKIPSVLVEVAFISNSEDAKKMATSTYREKAAQAIFEGILQFYKSE